MFYNYIKIIIFKEAEIYTDSIWKIEYIVVTIQLNDQLFTDLFSYIMCNLYRSSTLIYSFEKNNLCEYPVIL